MGAIKKAALRRKKKVHRLSQSMYKHTAKSNIKYIENVIIVKDCVGNRLYACF